MAREAQKTGLNGRMGIQGNAMKPIRLQKFSPGQSASATRRHSIGARELIIALIAFSLLAFVPSFAQMNADADALVRAAAAPLGEAEKPETNFPGSAFYFMDDTSLPRAANWQEPTLDTPEDSAGALPVLPAGAARPFAIRAGTTDYSRALQCLADAVYYEAALEPDAGQEAVVQVILNRVRHPAYPNTVCGVVYQGSERWSGCQFSYSCDGSMARGRQPLYWNRARAVAAKALNGSVYAPAGLATHYHTTEVHPYWAPSLHFVGTIGAHRFYRFRGQAGTADAFFRAYAGGEPLPGPKARLPRPTPDGAFPDPVQLQMAYEREYAAARVQAESQAGSHASASAPAGSNPAAPASQVYAAPDYAPAAKARGGERAFAAAGLPDSRVKREYQTSGSWKDPAMAAGR